MSKYLTLYIANNRDLLDKQFEDQHIDMLYGDMIPAEDFALLKKLIFDKSTVLEAAEELNISVEACKKRAQRAKFRLKENIEKSQEPKVYRRYVKKNGEFFLSKKKNTGKTIESSDMKSGRSEMDGNTSETSGKTIGTDKGKLHEKNGAEPQIDGKSPPSDGKTFQNG